ncbi:MAG: sialate O-acetylesterase [Phycisphaerales bacterium]
MRAATAAIVATLSVALPAWADITLPAVFTDHMVLQRERPVRIFGMAQPNESVEVAILDGAGATLRTGRTYALPDGHFSVTMDPLPATTTPLSMEVRGANTVRVEDILVGDVWLAGGQSNMEWPLGATGAQGAEGAEAATDPAIRFIKAPHVTAFKPATTIDARWEVCSPTTAPNLSAVAYWFAKQVRLLSGAPVGILSINWGGTRAEPWVDLATLSGDPDFADRVLARRAEAEAWESTSAADRKAAYEARRQEFQRAGTAWWSAVNAEDPGAKAKWYEGQDREPEQWRSVELPGAWSKDPALADFDGVVWYRRSIDVPAEWAGKECFLELGPIDDADVAFVDGRAIANTLSDWTTPRRYRIPASMVKGGPMLLAVEALDLHGEGGFMGAPETMKLVCPAMSNASIPLAGSWSARMGRTAAGIVAPPVRPVRDQPPGTGSGDLAAMFHGMIAPFAGFPIKGAIWYQGESNANNAAEAAAYRTLLPQVVRSWRAAFDQPDMPFGVVSLAAFRNFEAEKPCAGVWPTLRASQLAVEQLVPNAGVITTIDVGNAGDIHPRDKRTVGERLGRWAAATTYGKAGTPWRGPRARSARRDGDGIVIDFDVEGGSVGGRGGKPVTGFAIAGADGVFSWADATVLTNESIKVRSAKVPVPVSVRYAWQDNPENATLVDNASKLPAHPFEMHVAEDTNPAVGTVKGGR